MSTAHGRLRSILVARRLRRAAAGDERAFRAAFDELYPIVFGFAVARLPSRADAEDLTAEVFRRVVEKLADFDAARGSPRAWVLAIARNLLIDQLRRRRPRVPWEEVESELADGRWELDEPGDDETLRRVRRALATFPASTREMFALRYAEGLRYAEIAAVMGLRTDAVKQRFSRTLRQLRAKAAETTTEVGYAH